MRGWIDFISGESGEDKTTLTLCTLEYKELKTSQNAPRSKTGNLKYGFNQLSL